MQLFEWLQRRSAESGGSVCHEKVSGHGGSILSPKAPMEGRTTYLMGHSQGCPRDTIRLGGGAILRRFPRKEFLIFRLLRTDTSFNQLPLVFNDLGSLSRSS